MLTIQRIGRGAAAAIILASVGACANSQLENIVGGIGGVGQNGQLSGTIRSVDSRSQQIAIETSSGQTVPVSYDSQTQVVYQSLNYAPTALVNGDQVTARVQASGDSYYTDYVLVDQSVTSTGNGNGSSKVQLMEGTVRQVDRRNGLFTIDMNLNTPSVTLPANVSAKDLDRFNTLRTGSSIRFFGKYLSDAQIQLVQFR